MYKNFVLAEKAEKELDRLIKEEETRRTAIDGRLSRYMYNNLPSIISYSIADYWIDFRGKLIVEIRQNADSANYYFTFNLDKDEAIRKLNLNKTEYKKLDARTINKMYKAKEDCRELRERVKKAFPECVMLDIRFDTKLNELFKVDEDIIEQEDFDEFERKFYAVYSLPLTAKTRLISALGYNDRIYGMFRKYVALTINDYWTEWEAQNCVDSIKGILDEYRRNVKRIEELANKLA